MAASTRTLAVGVRELAELTSLGDKLVCGESCSAQVTFASGLA